MNAEERRGIVDETVQHLTQMLAEAEFLNPDRNQTNLGVQNTRNQEDRTLRVDVNNFDGQSLNPQVYVDQETSLERYFEYRDTLVDK